MTSLSAVLLINKPEREAPRRGNNPVVRALAQHIGTWFGVPYPEAATPEQAATLNNMALDIAAVLRQSAHNDSWKLFADVADLYFTVEHRLRDDKAVRR